VAYKLKVYNYNLSSLQFRTTAQCAP